MEKQISLEEEIFVPNKGWVKVEDVKLENKICRYYAYDEVTKCDGKCLKRMRYNKPRTIPGMRGSVLHYNPNLRKRLCFLNEIPYYPLYLKCPVFNGERI